MRHSTCRYPGVVKEYSPSSCSGVLELENGVRVTFSSTTFYSGRVTRAPRVGEAISVAVRDHEPPFELRDVLGVWATSAPQGRS